jgi:hypothetical protein
MGGAISERFFATGLALAQQKLNSVNGEEFLLVDRSGKPRAGLGLDAKGEVGLVLISKDGSKSLSLSPDDRQVVKLVDNGNRVLWSLP